MVFSDMKKKNIPDTLCSRRGVVIAIKLFEIEEQHDWKGFVTARGLHNGAKQFLKSYLNCNKHGLRKVVIEGMACQLPSR